MTTAGSAPFNQLVRQAIDWAVLLQSDRADDGARHACRCWRDSDPDRERAWQRVQQVLAAVRQDIGLLPSAGAAHAVLRASAERAGRRKALKLLTASLATALSAGWLAERHLPWQRLAADHYTGVGERKTVLLADGTRLVLNTDSAVSVRFDAAQRLIVLTRGEAALASGADSRSPRHRPLKVQTRHGLFEALGTRFIVRLEPASSMLTVEEGAVAIYPRDARGAPVIARAGMAYRTDGAAAVPADTRGLDSASWVHGALSVRNMRLADFLAEVARYRAGRVDCDEAVGELRLSGVYRLDDSDELLAMLPDILPVQVRYRTRYWVHVGAR
ncbi:fec operon regulator FecR [Pigmentiphaga humi]|uniref:Fec operon regulator FecR n=1 Tax=Pigmentiphaga humi TaxID=2478468 RepID=A0A3P4AYJ0_9BURK|nr:FecR domain-containing protein [Pigmentiphaga humi]VCU69139.1 fec operon regulator FecR [Pigmentiphaga humi]